MESKRYLAWYWRWYGCDIRFGFTNAADLRSKVKKLQADLASGKVHSFTGPIYDQKGNLMVAEGKTADDGMLAGMMTYVKGVEGDIPK